MLCNYNCHYKLANLFDALKDLLFQRKTNVLRHHSKTQLMFAWVSWLECGTRQRLIIHNPKTQHTMQH